MEKQPHTRRVPRRAILIVGFLAWIIGVPLARGVAPWALSLLSARRGWETGGPGIWNLTGLMPIAIGTAGLIWTMVTAFGITPRRACHH
jgi:hypothetical protein